MDDTIRIGFTGNRNGLSDNQKENIVNFLNQCDQHAKILVHHGDCVGSDTDFHNICVDHRTNTNKKLSIIILPPDKSILRGFNKVDPKFGDIEMEPKPYLVRNDLIVKNSDIVIGCPTNSNEEVLRSGTWSTIRKAKKAKKIVYIF